MTIKSLTKILAVTAVLSFVLVLDSGLAIGKDKAKGVKSGKTGGGPPAWAPAHGYRRKFKYYPKQKVYYDAAVKKYFWVDAGIVKVGVKLPESIKLSGDGVTLELGTEKPKLFDFK